MLRREVVVYGLVNRAVEGLVRREHGDEVWARVKASAGVEVSHFGRMQAYDDAITYRLVAAASEQLGVPGDELLIAFGRYWVEYVADEGYGAIFSMGGRDLRTFLEGLDAMHARVATGQPAMRPPSFLTEPADGGVVLHYMSERDGLGPMVIGLVQGLAHRFGETVTVRSMAPAGDVTHERFYIAWVEG